MTKKLYFDTDCLSSFLWVNQEEILFKLYPGIMVVPCEVFEELSKPCIPHLGRKIDELCSTGQFEKQRILLWTEESELFFEMINPTREDAIPIGKGEAAAISLAKVSGGIVASNNYIDIEIYIIRFGLEKLTTAEILAEAKKMCIIDDYEGNMIWDAMLVKKRVLPTATFMDYLNLTDKS